MESYNLENIPITAKSAILIEKDTGKILYAKDINAKRPMASTTKLMTAILAVEEGSLNDKVYISANARYTPYQTLNYMVGDRAYLEDVLAAMLIYSDNGSAAALGEHIGGTLDNFAKMMTKRAKELGCTNTSFKTPYGLDRAGHYTSAKDLATIAVHARKYPIIRELVKTKKYTFTTLTSRRTFTFTNSNQLLGKTGMYGMKTGYTDGAGGCFVGAYMYRNKMYISVVLGSSNAYTRFTDSEKLYEYLRDYI